MFSRPVLAAGPEGIRLASTTVGSMLPQPDSTNTMPKGSPFNFVIVTYNAATLQSVNKTIYRVEILNLFLG